MTKLQKVQSFARKDRSYFIKINDVLLLDNIVYLDRDMCVLMNNINDKVLTYYKRTTAGLYKICDLRVPDSASSFESSPSSSCETDSASDPSETDSFDDLSDYAVSDLDWTQEVPDADTVEVPEWARIEGLDFNIKKEDLEEQEFTGIDSNVNQNNPVTVLADEESCQKTAGFPIKATISLDNEESIEYYTKENHGGYLVLDWAAEEINDEEVDIPEWAQVPDFSFNTKSTDQMKNVPSFSSLEESHQFVGNWAEEERTELPVDIPEWAIVPDFSINVHEKPSSYSEKSECVYPVGNCLLDQAASVSDWASEAWEETDPDVPLWARVDFDMNSVYTNRNRINKRTHFLENVFGLRTVWE